MTDIIGKVRAPFIRYDNNCLKTFPSWSENTTPLRLGGFEKHIDYRYNLRFETGKRKEKKREGKSDRFFIFLGLDEKKNRLQDNKGPWRKKGKNLRLYVQSKKSSLFKLPFVPCLTETCQLWKKAFITFDEWHFLCTFDI